MVKICKLIREHSFKDIRIFEKEAISLRKIGHDVTIVAGKNGKYVLGPDRNYITDKTYQQDSFIYKDVHFLTYVIKYPLSSHVNEMIKALEENRQDFFIDTLYDKALSTDANVYHAHEWHTLYEAVQIKRSLRKKGRNVKVVFDAHELEADNTLMALMMKEVDHLITVSESIKEIYIKRYPGIPVTLIYNSPSYQEEIPVKNDNKDSFTIAYEGVVTVGKGNPQKILDITNLCKSKMENFRFEIIGRVPVRKYYQVMRKKINDNPYIECRWVDYHDLPKELSNVHVGYIFFGTNEENRNYALPNKFFSYLNNGVPVVVNQSHEMKNFVEKYQCGIVVEKEDPTAEEYVEAFQLLYQDRQLLNQMSKNGREAMRTIYCWERMEERLAEVYNSLK
ncbi:glycosyltransferase [Metabacillus hrfriensis]|uniref:Glycosyltransferase n=1 Tax=Metabacillus hrfriensis TaxID=3048891 RepID=A0ACD4RF17_9BACI|nr:glycosyltransferase [Metabacillus sp. CT-WN-B3]WHZ59092.1 glycosyltransferase [Metabacillus sp. CT-WN-B3]